MARHYGNYTVRADNVVGSSMATVELVPDTLPTSSTSPNVALFGQLKQSASAPVASGNRVRSTADNTNRAARQHRESLTTADITDLLRLDFNDNLTNLLLLTSRVIDVWNIVFYYIKK